MNRITYRICYICSYLTIPFASSYPCSPELMLRLSILLAAHAALTVVGEAPVVSIPIHIENGKMMTDAVSINAESYSTIVDFQSPDLILPICTPDTGTSNCYDPRKSGAFRYCSGDSRCFDRQSPPFSCARTTLSSEWSLDTASFTDHVLLVDGVVSHIPTFEFVATQASVNGVMISRVPAKGTVASGAPALLGLGPNRMSCRNETLVSRLGTNFCELRGDSIDFYAHSPPSTNQSMWTEQYQLSHTNASAVLGKYAFNLFNPTVCGVDLLGNVSYRWTAVVDTTQECLVLPEFLFNNLKAWKSGSNGMLYFGLTDGAGPGAVSMDLTDVCIQSQPAPFGAVDFAISGQRPIVFGIRALRALGPIGFETSHPFRMRFRLASSVSTQCSVASPVCVGQQVYHESSNACIDPPCGDYIFSEIDQDQRVCVWKGLTSYLVYAAIAVLVVGELVLHRLNKKITSLAQSACERNIETS